MKGMDVSCAQGRTDWKKLRAGGVEFAMIRASVGGRMPDGAEFSADPCLMENLRGAAQAGIAAGVYHTLCAGDSAGALAEADRFLRTVAPYREQIRLWAALHVEENGFLPRTRDGRTAAVHMFLKKVRTAGFRVMLYTTADFLMQKLNDVSMYDLWIAWWGVTEARALSLNPKIWQYGPGMPGDLRPVNMDRGYFLL